MVDEGKRIMLKKIAEDISEISYKFKDLMATISEKDSEYKKLKEIQDEIWGIADKLAEFSWKLKKS